ncbi:hypothetical protein [Zavarzinia sp.]|uniref:hypothetical protein n=1 Tax=Zavarzinia sp. TaxID=2027920 RepID=UPI0035643B0D
MFEGQLKLDPSIAQTMLDLKAQSGGATALPQWLQPNFQLLMPHWDAILGPGPNPPFLSVPAWSPTAGPGYQPIPAPKPLSKPGAGPETPRAGEISDLIAALYAVPAVQGLVQQAHAVGMRRLGELRDDWRGASGGERVLMVSVSGLVVGAIVTPILAYRPTRDFAFGMIKDKDIPVPGVEGLSFKIMERGAGATVPLGVTGLSASGHYNAPAGKAPDYGASVTFDLAAFLRARK